MTDALSDEQVAEMSEYLHQHMPPDLKGRATLYLIKLCAQAREANRLRAREAEVRRETVEDVALTFAAFREANKARCLKWHPAGIKSWSPSDWLTAVTGELGELASLLKMRNRERDGLPGNKFSPTDKMVADELADVLTYLDLLAEVLGVDLGIAAATKFNEVSERVGFPDRIALPPSGQDAATRRVLMVETVDEKTGERAFRESAAPAAGGDAEDEERLDWCERQWMNGLHIEACGVSPGGNAEPRKKATVYFGRQERQADTIRAAIDLARALPPDGE
jgi:NTP pyrophosphatase (non-canonical NTP hydrolase)